MKNLELILIYFFLLCLNNSCLIITLKSYKKINFSMKMDNKSKLKDVIIYKAKTNNQEKYWNYLNNEEIKLILAIGPAGTGKTLFACLKAISQLKNGEIKKLIITRPVVTVEEEIGFLPGNIVKKMDPWTRPIFDLFLEFFSKSELDNYINNNIIEISPLAFMRGRTFKNSFIIADEMQNCSPNQMKMLTTRIGDKSKIVITGDLKQTDIRGENGLNDLIYKLDIYNKYSNDTNSIIKIINFTNVDIERSEIVKKIIDIYELNISKKFIEQQQTNIKVNNNYQNYNIDNDAALIPKSQILKNHDIFYDDTLM